MSSDMAPAEVRAAVAATAADAVMEWCDAALQGAAAALDERRMPRRDRRVPFVASLVVVLVAAYVRRRPHGSPAFAGDQSKGAAALKLPSAKSSAAAAWRTAFSPSRATTPRSAS